MDGSHHDDDAGEAIERNSFGCEHYRRGCSLKSGCCGKFYICRMCHNDDDDNKCSETFDRSKVEKVKCLKCATEQIPLQNCVNCGLLFGSFFCAKCRLYDHTDKGQFHCDGCGICRVGGRDKFTHCDRCHMCIGKANYANHKCIERALDTQCPVCLEHLFDSTRKLHIPECGHVIHASCFRRLISTTYKCPTCNHSYVDMSAYFRELALEIEQTPMPVEYENAVVDVLCNDCHQKTDDVAFHILGHACGGCHSFNTVVEAGPRARANAPPPADDADDTSNSGYETESDDDESQDSPGPEHVS
eukprot:m.694732 g.694732  ORF g.694732 m.694732 type:complete len:302 (+) comp22884_c2_seq7:147-1052(+)